MKPTLIRHIRLLPVAVAMLLISAGCGASEPLTETEARDELGRLIDDIDSNVDEVTEVASFDTFAGETELAETLPPISEFPVVVNPPGNADVTVEIFVSTEKSGTQVETDGWIIEVAEDFNNAGVTLDDGRSASVAIRSIASGTGYQFIAGDEYRPDAFSPSNQLWVEMAGASTPMTEIRSELVPNVAGIVMKTETLEALQATSPTVDEATVIDAVVNGDIVMGYTNPFASSTGLNFLVTVLDHFAEGDEARLTDPSVASVFEEFQRQVPFVALTTLQLRESVENENGTLDAFVMEWQTFQATEALESGFEFIPFGVNHNNPLYAVGDLPTEKLDALELFATFAEQEKYQDRATEFGFNPEPYTSDVALPSGQTLIEMQSIWKENKDGGQPVAVMFVVDVSGSMTGTRIGRLTEAMLSAREFIDPETKVGVVEFNDEATLRLPVAEFDLNQQGRFVAVANGFQPVGGTAMYDGIIIGLEQLLAEKGATPDTRLVLIVLTDGETNEGRSLRDVDEVIAGLRVPIFSVGFEADFDELRQVSSLVEAATIDASEADLEFKMASLINATG